MENGLTSSSLQVVQLAITPVILLSGVGALMITLTNRMGRIVDRTRRLAEQVHGATRSTSSGQGEADRTHFESQLDIMWRRAGLVRLAVTLAGWSMLLSCFLIVVIFVDALLERKFGVEMVVIFAASVACLIGSLVSFLRDIGVSLRALHLEVDRARAR
jgi:hypothetical protein